MSRSPRDHQGRPEFRFGGENKFSYPGAGSERQGPIRGGEKGFETSFDPLWGAIEGCMQGVSDGFRFSVEMLGALLHSLGQDSALEQGKGG